MAKIRIAQRGWNGGRPAESAADVQVGTHLMWVEIDGYRISGGDSLIAATVRVAHDEFSIPTIELAISGAVEIVYVDKDGVELPGEPGIATPGEHFDHRTVRPADE